MVVDGLVKMFAVILACLYLDAPLAPSIGQFVLIPPTDSPNLLFLDLGFGGGWVTARAYGLSTQWSNRSLAHTTSA
jgi:hypothetical protein